MDTHSPTGAKPEPHKSASSQRHWRNILIEPFKQIKLGVYILTISFVFIILLMASIVNAFWQQYRQLMGLFQVVDSNTQWDLLMNPVFTQNVSIIAGILLVYILVLFLVIFKLTHRIYGPLVAVDHFIEEIRKGNYSARVNIRKKDELHDLTKALNDMAAELERKSLNK